ncbi:MAG: translational GTPase TypA [Buchnera aphidicola (Periphyllus lyropictus)]|uniref:translational GTPase TypA n=1 Tax=Buchnera aphidicola TaxID=9 RepID=UPI001EBE8BA4|nr:translational GTPase TypA [Buchnera aphidicola]NIH16547.1 translational GTPase TypA [Buchnera aphidicola (Periphyllus lyropictus)]USS94440.1 translational GTPase TypA [Buchnera aphidicola (Periphyllus lyropictus)]
MNQKFRNIAIIAHVDHGKTTLIDKLLQESGIFKNHEEKKERVMDSNDLEKERGITITSKNTSIIWKKYKINIVDTPGHADFGGEVERVLSMVDSVLLVVDALDGPMPQTRFVTEKAFKYNINPIVVVNKIDRKNARPDWVIDQIFDLFVNLNANDKQLDFPIIYTSAILGKSGLNHESLENNMTPLFESIIKYTPAPKKNIKKKFKMQISQLDYDNYLGMIGIGRIKSGKIKINQRIKVINKQKKIYFGKINKLLTYYGLKKIEKKSALSGDIVAISGIPNIKISDTICDIKNSKPLPKLNIDKPTVKMFFSVNSSPFSGKEGKYITSRNILERLNKEKMYNVALKVEETKDSSTFCVSGRGELHLSILIENMRREGYELEVSRPKVIFKNINGIEKEPFENIILDIEEKHQGVIMKYLGERKGEIQNMISDNKGRVRLEYIISSRALIGFRSELINITSGTGLFCSSFSHYSKLLKFNPGQRRNGVLISNNTGMAVAFALYNLQDRGKLFLGHGTQVYQGQIIGMHSKSNDLTVNCLLGKKLTNMRASGTDEAINLIKPVNLTLEQAMSFINDDELIEITPKSVRLRKKFLTENERKCAFRKK